MAESKNRKEHTFRCPQCGEMCFSHSSLQEKKGGYMQSNKVSEYARDIAYQCYGCGDEFKTKEVYALAAPKTVRKRHHNGTEEDLITPFDILKLASSISKASFAKKGGVGLTMSDCIKLARTVHASLSKSGFKKRIDSYDIGEMVLAVLYHANYFATFVRYLLVFKGAEALGIAGILDLVLQEQKRINNEYINSIGSDTLLDPEGKSGIKADVLERKQQGFGN